MRTDSSLKRLISRGGNTHAHTHTLVLQMKHLNIFWYRKVSNNSWNSHFRWSQPLRHWEVQIWRGKLFETRQVRQVYSHAISDVSILGGVTWDPWTTWSMYSFVVKRFVTMDPSKLIQPLKTVVPWLQLLHDFSWFLSSFGETSFCWITPHRWSPLPK